MMSMIDFYEVKEAFWQDVEWSEFHKERIWCLENLAEQGLIDIYEAIDGLVDMHRIALAEKKIEFRKTA